MIEKVKSNKHSNLKRSNLKRNLNKRKFYPKSKKSCKKRNMKWNSSTKKCNLKN